MPIKNIFVVVAVLFIIALAVPSKQTENVPTMRLTASAIQTQDSASGAVPENPYETYFPVIKVVDGDTITVNVNGKNETVRLIGLDTPETVDPRKPVQCFGEQASEKAKELLTGKSVRIEMDPSQGERDKYGRLLAYVFLEDGTLFNKLIIKEGFGHEYTYNLPYKYREEFTEAEKTARKEKKGLWAPQACTEQASQINAENSPQISADINTSGKMYDCSQNAYNCSSFKTQAEAQYVFDLCGGDKNDIHKLDRDMDGKVCESLP